MTKSAFRNLMLLSGAFVATATAAPGASAQASGPATPFQSSPAPAPVKDTGNPIAAEGSGEIIVTAQRRSENVQKIPLAIQAVQGVTLSKAGVFQFSQLAAVTPTFAYSAAGSNPSVTLRGIGTQIGQIAGESSVALQLDGAPLLRLQYLLGSFFDVERVEILRGPQGTIAGRNATGGEINIISREPTFEAKGGAEADYGNYDAKTFSLWASTPVISDKLAAHFAVERRLRDGYVQSSVTGERLGGVDDVLLRGSLLAKPTEKVRLLVSGDYYDSQDQSPAFVNVGLYDPSLGLALPNVLGKPNGASPDGAPFGSESYYNPKTHVAVLGGVPGGPEYFKQRTYGFNGHLTIDISDKTQLKAVSDYHHLFGDNYYDAGRSATPVTPVRETYHQHQFTQEVVITSGIGDSLDLLGGGQYIKETAEENTSNYYLGGLIPVFVPAFASVQYTDTIKLRSLAGFGQATWRFLPQLALTVGGRYTSDKKTASGTAQLPIGGPFLGGRPVTLPSRTFNSFTPRVALDWKPNSNITTYVSASKGFKGGGFGSAIALGAQAFEPETVWNYEGGVKTLWLDHRLTVNVTAFWADYKNIQYAFYVAQQTIVKNAGAARSRGVELETSFRPDKAVEIGLNATYLDARFRQFCAADPLEPTLPTVTCPDHDQGQIQNGKRLPQAPKVSIAGNASYIFDLGNSGSLTLRGDVRYQSKTYFTVFNFNASQNAYAVVNARLTYDMPNGLSFSAFASNMFNKSYFTSETPLGDNLAGPGFLPLGVLGANVGQPRMYGGSIAFKW